MAGRSSQGVSADRPEYEFCPPIAPADPPSRPDEQRGRLAASIRAAHGAGVRFEWRIRSGPRPVARLFFPDRDGVRWWSRLLVSAYDGAGWTPARADERPSVSADAWFATRLREWPAPFRAPGDPGAWVDCWSAQLGLAPAGYELRWALRPAVLARSFRAPSGPALADPRSRSDRHRTTADRSAILSAPEPEDRAPAWWSRVVLLPPAGAPADVDARQVVSALESATRSSNGNGLRFHRVRPFRLAGVAEFPVAEADLRDAFPGAHHRAVLLPRSPSRTLALGRLADGRPAGPKIEPGQGRHLAILGETGMGKSSLLTALCQRVAREDGLVLFDPFGDAARAVRSGLSGVASERLRWIDPRSAEGLNALAGLASSEDGSPGGERRLNDLVHALRRVREGRFGDGGFWGPRLEEMLGRALRAASAIPGGTLVEAHALLAAEGRGFRQVPPESMEAVRALAERIRARPEDADGARRLLFEIARNPDLVRLLCAREARFRATDLVRPGSIVLLAGDAAVVGESTARYLLSVYLALLWAELLARPASTKTWVVLDEAQWFAHEALAEMLRMARRCDVHVVLATQAVGALPDPVREAVWTNVADFVIFRGSPADARDLARSVRGVRPESVLALPRGEAFLLTGKGQRVDHIRTVRALRPRPDADAEHEDAPSERPGPGPGKNDSHAPAVDPTGVGRVLEAIARRGRAHADVRVLRIPLDELRREADPGGRCVREVGNRLAECGALLERRRDERGSFWLLDPALVPRSFEQRRRIGAPTAPPLSCPAEAAGTPGVLDPSVYP